MKQFTSTFLLICLAFAANGRTFVHPGIAEGEADIARARKKIAAHAQPWTDCFHALRTCWSADPRQKVRSAPAILLSSQCNAHIGQAGRRAHDLALMYRLTGDPIYATKAIEFLNAQSHYTTLRDVGTGPLDFGKIYLLVTAAELLRDSPLWLPADRARFSSMLRTRFLPQIQNGDPGRFGNQGLFAFRGAIAIAIFLEDEVHYDRIWRHLNHLPLRQGEHSFPSGPPICDLRPCASNDYQLTFKLRRRDTKITNYGYDEQLCHYIYPNGQSQEAGRDQPHALVGLGLYVDIAEAFHLQGDDLYGALDNRILLGLEWSLRYNLTDWEPAGFTDKANEATFANGLFYRARHRSGRWQSLRPTPRGRGTLGGPGFPRECALAHYRDICRLPASRYTFLDRAVIQENTRNGGFETWGAAPNWYYEWTGWGTLMKRR